MSRFQIAVAVSMIPLLFLGCSEDAETEYVIDPAPVVTEVAPATLPISDAALSRRVSRGRARPVRSLGRGNAPDGVHLASGGRRWDL